MLLNLFKTLLLLLVVLPLDCDLDEVLLLDFPKKDRWGGLPDGPWAMEVVESR